jgi:hypothetical protein
MMNMHTLAAEDIPDQSIGGKGERPRDIRSWSASG